MTEQAPAELPIDPREFRRASGLFATGITVITTRVDDDVHGMTANAFTTLSLSPLLIIVCVDRRARMHSIVQQAGVFAVNFLHEGQEVISRNFAGQPGDHIDDILHFSRDDGVPVILGCLASLRCTVHDIVDGGDHVIIIGEVTQLMRGDIGAHPLIYFGGTYRRLLVENDNSQRAPEPWLNSAVRVYHEEWNAIVGER